MFGFNVQVSSAATSTNVDKFFSAVKTSQPLKIEAARKKYVEVNSSADFYAKIIINHYKATEYLKTVDSVGNVSPTAPDLPAKMTKSKTGIITIDSTFDTIDGSYRNFKLNKSKKITSFEFKSPSSGYKSIKGNIQTLSLNYNDSGTEFKTGYHWNLPNNFSFVQLDMNNNFGGFKSWSYARGYIRDASGINHDVKTGPLGCTTTGAKVVIEATTSTVAAIVKGTTSVLIIPMFSDCKGVTPASINVPFLVQ
jgi:hypothetical protein